MEIVALIGSCGGIVPVPATTGDCRAYQRHRKAKRESQSEKCTMQCKQAMSNSMVWYICRGDGRVGNR